MCEHCWDDECEPNERGLCPLGPRNLDNEEER